MKRKVPVRVLLLGGLFLFLCAACAALLLGGYLLQEEVAGLLRREEAAPAPAAAAPTPAGAAGRDTGMTLEEALAVTPADARQAILAEMGPPDAFSLRFETLAGQTVRWESWSYFDFHTRFDFVDGELLWRAELAPVPDGSIYAHFYDPADFRAGMSVEAVQALLGEQAPAPLDLADGDIEGGLALAGDQILLGFQDDRLVFVETAILSPGDGGERLPAAAAPATAPAPTPSPAPAGGEPLLRDDFSGPSPVRPLRPETSMTMAVEEGQARLTPHIANLRVMAAYPEPRLHDFVAEVTVDGRGFEPGTFAGLLLRGEGASMTPDRYQLIMIGPVDRQLWLETYLEGAFDFEPPVTIPEAALGGDSYRLRVEVKGTTYRVFVNDVPVGAFENGLVAEAGVVGLAARADRPGTTISFDELVVYPQP